MWDSHNDYPQSTGHGIGSYLSVQECNDEIANLTKQNEFIQ